MKLRKNQKKQWDSGGLKIAKMTFNMSVWRKGGKLHWTGSPSNSRIGCLTF